MLVMEALLAWLVRVSGASIMPVVLLRVIPDYLRRLVGVMR
jgi:hypothetical protein